MLLDNALVTILLFLLFICMPEMVNTMSLINNRPSSDTTSSASKITSTRPIQTVISSRDVNLLIDRAIQVFQEKERNNNNNNNNATATKATQILIGIAGCPGSGKSTRTEKICELINRQGQYRTKIIPMDGYHISQQQLRKLSSELKTNNIICHPELVSNTNDNVVDRTTISLTYDEVMKRRGAPWTFDSKQLVYDLQNLKQNGNGMFPIYSRDISDPIPNGVQITTTDQIIFCEGNYLLCWDDTNWAPLQTIFDDTWYIDVPIDVIKSRLITRHLKRWTSDKEQRFGIGRAGATAKVESSDLLNAKYITNNSKHNANVIIKNY